MLKRKPHPGASGILSGSEHMFCESCHNWFPLGSFPVGGQCPMLVCAKQIEVDSFETAHLKVYGQSGEAELSRQVLFRLGVELGGKGERNKALDEAAEHLKSWSGFETPHAENPSLGEGLALRILALKQKAPDA